MPSLAPIIAGALLAGAAVLFVLSPLLARRRPGRRPTVIPDGPPTSAIDALREIEFDRETGKLSEADYTALKAAYTERALAQMRAAETLALPAAAAPPAAFPVCTACGPRPQSDAIYCSRCGRYLAGACARCSSPVTEPAAQFCSACGQGLAA
jgi:double zinc ribbon protein